MCVCVCVCAGVCVCVCGWVGTVRRITVLYVLLDAARPQPGAAPARARAAPRGPRRAMRAFHLEATDGEGALPAGLTHRVDGEEYLGGRVVCWGGEHLGVRVGCACWSATVARGSWRAACRGA